MNALILYVSIGSGHRRAAEVLADTFARQFGWRCHTVDLLSVVSPRLPDLANSLSALLLKIAASFYDQYWADDEALRGVDRLLLLADLPGLMREMLAEMQPAICVCTHALPARILSLLWLKDGRSLPTLNVATDFMVNGLWPVERMAAYVVAAEAARRRLIARGFPADQVYPLGIPIADHFHCAVRPRAALRRQFALADKPTLLAITGGWRIEPYEQIASLMRQLFQYWAGGQRPLAAEWQIVVITGQNRDNLAALQRLAGRLPVAVTLLPFVQNVADWMRASDLMLTKPGGLTVAEALSCDLPLLLAGIGPGQERANAAWLAGEGCAAIGAAEIDHLAGQIADLLTDAAQLAAMRALCRELARPHAAEDIAGLAHRLLLAPVGQDFKGFRKPIRSNFHG
ncbi:MAG: hypothetical protein IPM39_08590 [Chloroflexi bacterium]|nr:hypothetical protein [Chloroflexota bacterium]